MPLAPFTQGDGLAHPFWVGDGNSCECTRQLENLQQQLDCTDTSKESQCGCHCPTVWVAKLLPDEQQLAVVPLMKLLPVLLLEHLVVVEHLMVVGHLVAVKHLAGKLLYLHLYLVQQKAAKLLPLYLM